MLITSIHYIYYGSGSGAIDYGYADGTQSGVICFPTKPQWCGDILRCAMLRHAVPYKSIGSAVDENSSNDFHSVFAQSTIFLSFSGSDENTL